MTQLRHDSAGRRRRVGDRGSASLWLVGLMAVLLGLGVAGLSLGAAVASRHRAQGAADLGALAGALHANEGKAAACARAATVTTANGARPVRCDLDGLDVSVVVEVNVGNGFGPARAEARAGPVRDNG